MDRGHEVTITAGNKDISLYLLDHYSLDHIKVGKSVAGLVPKALNLLKKEYVLYRIVKEKDPDLLISLTSPTLCHAAWLNRKKHIAFADTEHADLAYKLALPFTEVIHTPSCFQKDLGKKHVRYEGYQELAYLHPSRFTPNPQVLEELGVAQGERFIILRFVAWTAHHDIGHEGLDLDMKWKMVQDLEKYGKVFITSETILPDRFEPYKITVVPEKMHDLLNYATLFLGESATMASECAVLGTPAIFIDFAGRGYTDEEEIRYGLVYNFSNEGQGPVQALEKAKQLLEDEHLEEVFKEKREILLKDKIDVTAYILDVIRNYS